MTSTDKLREELVRVTKLAELVRERDEALKQVSIGIGTEREAHKQLLLTRKLLAEAEEVLSECAVALNEWVEGDYPDVKDWEAKLLTRDRDSDIVKRVRSLLARIKEVRQ